MVTHASLRKSNRSLALPLILILILFLQRTNLSHLCKTLVRRVTAIPVTPGRYMRLLPMCMRNPAGMRHELLLLMPTPTFQVPKCARPRCHGTLGKHSSTRPGGAGQLLQFPHMLPLLLGGHLVRAVRRGSPFLLLCALLCESRATCETCFGCGIKGVEGYDEEEGVYCSVIQFSTRPSRMEWKRK